MFRSLNGLLASIVLAATFVTAVEVDAQVRVRGYTRKDGTYVAPHYRSRPDGNFWNNWSTIGNVNPYTRKPGTKVTPPPGYGRSRTSGIASTTKPERRAVAFVEPVKDMPAPGGEFAAAKPDDARPAAAKDDEPIFVEAEKSGSSYSISSELEFGPTEQQLRIARMAALRELIAARQRSTWASLPTKNYTDEDLAACKLQAARLLIQNGRLEAGEKWLNQVLDLHPKTSSAATARQMLVPVTLALAK